MRRTIVLLSALAALAGSSPAAAQEPAAAPAAEAAPPQPAPAGEAAAAPLSSGLPERVAPPRTLRAHWHVFVAFALTWLLLFGYALSLGRRFTRVEAELRRLGGATE